MYRLKTSQGIGQQQGIKSDSNVTCLKCREKGHKAEHCVKVNLVKIPCLFGVGITPPITKPGKVGGREVELFMDSGADMAIIARELLPDEYIQCYPVQVTGVNSKSQPRTFQTALFPAVVDGHEVTMIAAVEEGDHLPHPFIIGRSVPGLEIKWQVDINK